MLAEGIVLYPLTWYLQQVLPNQFGVRRHPLFFLAPLKKLFQRKPPAGTRRAIVPSLETLALTSALARPWEILAAAGYDTLATDEAGPPSATSNLTHMSSIVTEERLRYD